MLRTCLQALKHRRSACQALLGPQLAATGQPFATPVLAMDAVLARSLQPFGASLRFVKRKTQPKNPASAAEVKVRQLRVNLEIKAEEVRLVDGEKHSLMPRSEAIARARAANHELVQVGSDRGVPVCKVMKYSAYLADQKSMHEAKAEAQRKGPGAVKLKGIRIGCNIAPHDLQTKKKQLQDFVEKGHQVAVGVTYERARGKWKEQYPKAVEVAKQLHQQLHLLYKAWFDYSGSGNDQITVVYTKGEPVGQVKATPPWEAGSQPPPFLLQMQQEAKRRQHERESRERAKAEALRRPISAEESFRWE